MSTPFAYQKAASLISLRSQELSEGRQVRGREAGALPCSGCQGCCAGQGAGSLSLGPWRGSRRVLSRQGGNRALSKLRGVSLRIFGNVAQIQPHPGLLCSSFFS